MLSITKFFAHPNTKRYQTGKNEKPIYLLIGMMWAGIYTVLEGISPDSFSETSETADFLYFSFITLTTVGFGDVAPLSIQGKRLAVFEAASVNLEKLVKGVETSPPPAKELILKFSDLEVEFANF